MKPVPTCLTIQKESIIQLLNQLTTEYPTLKVDLKKIAEQDPGMDDQFSFLEEFELLIVNICGYAKQVQASASVKQVDSAIAHLQQLQVFANTTIAEFYLTARGKYPQVQNYLQLLDYLRLLTLEYLQMQQTMQPISV